MKNRHRFRPSGPETMEERVVLSHAVVHTAAASVMTQNMAAKGLKIGSLGDSLSDEYRFYTPDRSQARNWVEILAATRHANFGAFSLAKRVVPRNAGFANNWAESGATTNDMVADQLPGLTTQVRRGQVNTVSILAGANDFLYQIEQYELPQTPVNTGAAINQVEANAENNITTAVQTLMLANSNVHVVLFTLPDVTELPAVQSAFHYQWTSTVFAQTSAAISNYNAHIESLASGNSRIAVVDLAAQLNSLQQQAAATGTANVGGITVNTTSASDNYQSLFLADQIHPGTVEQAAIANGFIQAIDTQFSAGIKPLTTAEVLRIAKRPPAR